MNQLFEMSKSISCNDVSNSNDNPHPKPNS